MTEILGYTCALLIGLSLGLIGGGGSILTVPVMVYLFGISPVLSTAYSLFVVGFSALIGVITNIRKGLVHYRTALVFAIPSFIAVFLTRYYLLPWIPEEIFVKNEFVLTKDIAIMVFFAAIMLIASLSMIRSGNQRETSDIQNLRFNYPLIIVEGAMVGVLTGLVGAGGGFLIIPALVLLVRLPMKMAVGTSLFIIATKSLIGFLGDVGVQEIDWKFLLIFSGIAGVGILLGTYLSNFIEGRKLKGAFGWFVLMMAIYILYKELYLA